MRQQNFCFAKLWLVFPVAAVFVLAFGIPIASAQGFDPGCTVPFDAIKEHHPIDDSCSIEGVGASDAHLAQNRAKNNFCAAAPIRISYNSFLRLQRGAEQKDIPFGSSNSLPEDRSVLRDLYTTTTGVKLGESSLVQYVAFIIATPITPIRAKVRASTARKGAKRITTSTSPSAAARTRILATASRPRSVHTFVPLLGSSSGMGGIRFSKTQLI